MWKWRWYYVWTVVECHSLLSFENSQFLLMMLLRFATTNGVCECELLMQFAHTHTVEQIFMLTCDQYLLSNDFECLHTQGITCVPILRLHFCPFRLDGNTHTLFYGFCIQRCVFKIPIGPFSLTTISVTLYFHFVFFVLPSFYRIWT